MTDNYLKHQIIKTIAYFDVLNYPLTKQEIFTNILSKNQTPLNELENNLVELLQNKNLDYDQGFYFLFGKQNMIEQRKNNYSTSLQKIFKAKKWLYLISKTPFVKTIFVCNNLAYLNATDKSDIDLAIITQSNKIWTTRFLVNFAMKFFNKRPSSKKTKNKICLSFFITEDELNLKDLAYDKDIHFYFWVKQFLLIYDENNLSKNFYKHNNWLLNIFPNYKPQKTILQIKPQQKTTLEKIFGFEFIEKFFKFIQLKILSNKTKKLAEENNTNVVISDKILKFHTKDNRQEILQKWLNNLKSY